MARRQSLALAGEAAQHGVDQAFVDAVWADQGDRAVDRGMGRRAEEHELAGAEPEDVAQPRRPARQWALEAMVDQGVDLAEAAQGRGAQQAGEGPVAGVHSAQAMVVGQDLVEGRARAEDRAENVEGGAAR